MSNSIEEVTEQFVYSMYGKCQIQMVDITPYAVFIVMYAPKDVNDKENAVLPLFTSALNQEI